MKLPHVAWILLVGALAAYAQEPAPPSPAPAPPRVKERKLDTLFNQSYPLDVSIALPAALFHWVDCLGNSSEAKTIPLHQQEYIDKFGQLTEEDIGYLKKFRAVRLRGKNTRLYTSMLGVFLEAPTLRSAFDQVNAGLGAEGLDAIATTLEYFRPKYEKIWQDGRLPNAFLEGAKEDPGRKNLEDFLARVAHFFAVDPIDPPRPMLVLVPVPGGDGTHAQAVGRTLLVEVRPDEHLLDEAAPIVHENAHYLWLRMGEERKGRLEEIVKKNPAAKKAWETLREALPTAIGQGVAAHTFRGATWSDSVPWYHSDEVDSYAKAIYPLIQESLDAGGVFDELLLKKILRKYPGVTLQEQRPRLTPR